MNNKQTLQSYILIIILGCLLFIPYIDSVHLFDWDETNFAEASREMLVTGDYLTVRIDYKPFHEKPPLFFWLQAISMKCFGVNEFGARFPNSIIGIITLLLIFKIGKKLFDFRLGLLWVITYIGSVLPFFYFKTGLIDPIFNLFMFLGIYYISEFYFDYANISPSARKYKSKNQFLAGIFVSLALLTKGPVGFLLPALTWLVYAIIKRKYIKFPILQFLFFIMISFIPIVLWYLLVTLSSGNLIISDFIIYQFKLLTESDGGHGGPIYYHLIVLFVGCFPASILLLRSFRKQTADNVYQSTFKTFNIIYFAVIIIIFSIVRTKIVHYSSSAYLPITFLAAYAIYSIAYSDKSWKKTTTYFLSIIGVFWFLVLLLLPLALINKEMIIPKIQDEFTRQVWYAHSHWSGWEWTLSLILLIGLIISLIQIYKMKYLQGFLILCGATTISLFTFLPLVVPKIEYHVQGAAVEFYKSLVNKDANIFILDLPAYRYGQYFYSQKSKELSSEYNKNIPKENLQEYFLKGDIIKPVYFLTKATDAPNYIKIYNLKLQYYKNGMAVLLREAK